MKVLGQKTLFSSIIIVLFILAIIMFPSAAYGFPFANIQKDKDNVEEQIQILSEELDKAGDQYHEAQELLSSAEEKIQEYEINFLYVQEELGTLQTKLSTRVTSIYKTGPIQYVDVLLGTESFESFIEIWSEYEALNSDTDLINQVSKLKELLEIEQQKLEEQKSDLKRQVELAQNYMDNVRTKQEEYKQLYDSLSQQTQEVKLLNIYLKMTIAAIQETQENMVVIIDAGNEKIKQTVEYAYSKVGCPYIWGAASENAFDCSGLVLKAYEQIGISLPHYTESIYSMARYIVSPQDAPPGSILYHPNHVGISLGGTNCIEAMGEAWGVVESNRDCWTCALII